MTPPIDLAAVRKLADAATPGPWHVRDDVEEQIETDSFKTCCIYVGREDPDWIKSMVIGMHWYDGPQLGCRAEDAAFIAEARTLVPAMAEEIEALREIARIARKATETLGGALTTADLVALGEAFDNLDARAEQPHRTAEERAR